LTPEITTLPAADQLTSLIDSALILEEDEIHAESSCASSDDGFGSSCQDTEQKRSQAAESDFLLSDDSAAESEQQGKERKRKSNSGVEQEAEHLHRMLMANQQVTAL
jgi:hypothetical protein